MQAGPCNNLKGKKQDQVSQWFEGECCEGQTLVDTMDTYFEAIAETPDTY